MRTYAPKASDADRQWRETTNAVHHANELVDSSKREVRQAAEKLEAVRDGHVDLIKRNGYIGPETTEANVEKCIAFFDREAAQLLAQQAKSGGAKTGGSDK